MQKRSKDSQNGCINSAVNFGWIETSPGIFSSNLRHAAIFTVPIAQDPKFHVIFLLMYLEKLSMKHHSTERNPSRCICLENPCCILKLLKLFGISNKGDIRFYSQQMEFFLANSIKISKKSTKSSGLTKKISKFQKS